MCIPQIRLRFHAHQPVDVGFDAALLSSNGGAILLRQVDDQLNVSERLAELVPDDRSPSRVVHTRVEQLRQRLYQISLGYEDCNDAETLRLDPALQVACDLGPRDRTKLSSQPTLSRMENSVTAGDIRPMLDWLEQSYVEQLGADTDVVVLDIDTTADPTHGSQQLAFFHGFYDTHMYHPLLVFDGVSGQLITAVLRPGNAHAARGALGVLRRLVGRIKDRFPSSKVVVRGDSGFCVPRILEGLEELDRELGDVDYVLGLARNKVLERTLQPALDEARRRFERCRRPQRLLVAFDYAAGSWTRPRRVIGKAEHHAYGPNPRFVLTSLNEFEPRLLYAAYCQRGQAENFIKDFKNGLNADRLSCRRFSGNFFRLILHAAAYRLMHALRSAVGRVSKKHARLEFATLRLKLLKVAVQVGQSVRRLTMRVTRAFPLAAIFRKVAIELAAPT